ncbi:MAG: cysteine--tRNA ligase, partial [Gemmatimonadetes bacterium]
MALRLHNTLTRSVEPFEPLDPPIVRIYGCGPTIYAYPHIGNYRSFLVYDLVHRYLDWRGYDVRFVVNLTDVDDKTIEGAAASGVSLREFTEPFGRAFLEDAETLGVRPFDAYPRATEYIGPMIGWIRKLEERGLAYAADDGSVYFQISAFPGYGRLRGLDPDQLRVGARVAVDEYDKEDARDFVLWKAARAVD